MFSTSDIYKMIKPEKSPDLITSYEVVIGGTLLPAQLKKGVVLVSVINSRPITSQYDDLQDIVYDEQSDVYLIKQGSYLQTTYQIDIYKINDKNARVIQAEVEAYKLYEWLKSYEVSEYLSSINASILPVYSSITFLSEYLNRELVNRALFEISIISRIEIREQTDIAESAIIQDMYNI